MNKKSRLHYVSGFFVFMGVHVHCHGWREHI
jgi:hypothetical protein